MYKALTIAGSDSGGGAGIQADLKTFSAFGVYGTSALTALTAQNTLGVQGVYEVEPEFVFMQIASVMEDIGSDAAKTGMLANSGIISKVAEAIKKYKIRNLVIDPVMIAKSGDPLLSEDARKTIIEKLIPLARVITPNVFEAEVMLDQKIKSLEDMRSAAIELKKTGCEWVVVKGGHLESSDEAKDVVYNGQDFEILQSQRFATKNTHGTGCTFSAAIAAGLAKGYQPLQAIQKAKQFITKAIEHNISLGSGHGPANHLVGVRTMW
jgi:hydroxymethylpyrimidine/phosphomethylpyrimidine kinase